MMRFAPHSPRRRAPSGRRSGIMWHVPMGLAAVTAMLAFVSLSRQVGGFDAQAVPSVPDMAALEHIVVLYAWLPRLVVAFLAGGALALAGAIFQQTLGNPMAEPLTLGVSAGASLAMTVAAIWIPDVFVNLRFWVACSGALAAIFITLGLTWRKQFAPASVILAGMIVNLYCGAVGLILIIANERFLAAVFVWGGGSLSQSGWDGTLWLLPRLAAGAVIAFLSVRPLALFSLGGDGARQLGLSLSRARLLLLGVATVLSASVVSVVGVIGFIGLGGPVIARLIGARRLRDQLLWAPLIGGLLLTLADQAVQCLPSVAGQLLPTGAVIAVLGGPLLLWLVRRLRAFAPEPAGAGRPPASARRLKVTVTLLVCALVAAVVVSVEFADTMRGWQWLAPGQWHAIAMWRVPRLVASAAAGIMLSIAGTILQRMTGNPMASPELLGVGGGAMLGILCASLLSAMSAASLLGAAFLGAVCGLALMVYFARRVRFAPTQVLLVGVAITGMAQSIVALATANGGAYANLLRSLTLGATYLVGPSTALLTAACAVPAMGAALWVGRWLDILPLGGGVSDSLGVNTGRARLLLLVLASAATAGATIVVGPLSFVGLMAPHLARLLGFSRARSQLLVAGLVGALVMILADWAGRNVLFPQQMPAGILAALIGGPYLLWLIRR